jgi:amidophosphoribosyltransferase
MAKDVGAKKVIVASCAPPIRYANSNLELGIVCLVRVLCSYPNVYGIDMPSRSELVAYGRDYDSIASEIGADLVIFQTLADLEASVRQLNPNITTFDCSVFTGEYITGGVDEAYLQHIEGLRADNVRGKVKTNGLGQEEGWGGGGGTAQEQHEQGGPEVVSSSMNAMDDTVGLHNSWKSA